MAKEKNFENRIKAFLKNEGVYHFKFFANGMTKRGIPDIIANVAGNFVAIEVKAEDGSPSKLQIQNVNDINETGGFAVIVKPSQFKALKLLILEIKSGNATGENNKNENSEARLYVNLINSGMTDDDMKEDFPEFFE